MGRWREGYVDQSVEEGVQGVQKGIASQLKARCIERLISIWSAPVTHDELGQTSFFDGIGPILAMSAREKALVANSSLAPARRRAKRAK